MKQYDLVIIGSGFRAVGLAERVKNSLIVDAHYLTDPEYCGTFSGFTPYPCRAFDEKSAELRRIFEDCGALKEGTINVLCAEPCLSEYVRRRGIAVLLGATLIEVGRDRNKYVVRLQTSAGLTEVGARTVIRAVEHLPDRIRFLMCGDKGSVSFSDTEDMHFSVSDAFFDGEFILTVGVREPIEQNTLKTLAVRAVSESVRGSGVKIAVCAENGFSSEFCRAASDPITDFEIGFDEGEKYLK